MAQLLLTNACPFHASWDWAVGECGRAHTSLRDCAENPGAQPGKWAPWPLKGFGDERLHLSPLIGIITPCCINRRYEITWQFMDAFLVIKGSFKMFVLASASVCCLWIVPKYYCHCAHHLGRTMGVQLPVGVFLFSSSERTSCWTVSIKTMKNTSKRLQSLSSVLAKTFSTHAKPPGFFGNNW